MQGFRLDARLLGAVIFSICAFAQSPQVKLNAPKTAAPLKAAQPTVTVAPSPLPTPNNAVQSSQQSGTKLSAKQENDAMWANLGALGNFLSGIGSLFFTGIGAFYIHRANSRAAETRRREELAQEDARHREEELHRQEEKKAAELRQHAEEQRHEEARRSAAEKQKEEWSREFREIHADFWKNESLVIARRWIANDNLYASELEPVLLLRKFGIEHSEKYHLLEALDRFCAVLAQVLYLHGQTMTEAQKRLWKMMYYEYWLQRCEKRELIAEYMDKLWHGLHRQGKLAHEGVSPGQIEETDVAVDKQSVAEMLRWINSSSVSPVLEYFDKTELAPIDLSAGNIELASIDPKDTGALVKFIDTKLAQSGKKFLIGGYGEKRSLYERSSVFSGMGEPRNVHLGVDLWGKAGDRVLCPLPGKVHSFKDNAKFGDYGPTIILKHTIWDTPFYSLYGHLSKSSLQGLVVNKPFKQGDYIGTLGNPEENGNWPAHLHFQLIFDIGDHVGDYPGVIEESKAEEALKGCPDPNIILRL